MGEKGRKMKQTTFLRTRRYRGKREKKDVRVYCEKNQNPKNNML